MRPARFTRQVALPVWLQRAAYMPPLRLTRDFHIAVMSRVDPQSSLHIFLFVPLAQTPPYLLSFIFYLLSLLLPFPKYFSTFLYSGCCFADRFVVYCM